MFAHADAHGGLPIRILPVLEDRETQDRCIAVARATLEDDDFAVAWAESRQLTREEAVAEAVGKE